MFTHISAGGTFDATFFFLGWGAKYVLLGGGKFLDEV